jgi:hypothetical protein
MSEADVGAGGYRRARIRRRRHLPGWKPLTGQGCECKEGGTAVRGTYQPPDAVGAVPRGVRRKALPVAKTAVTANPKVRAGMFLLNQAEKNPAAKRKVKRIVRRAEAGDPQAISTVRTLRVAKRANQQKKRRAIAAARQRRRALAMAPAAAALTPVEVPAPRGIFKFWDKGSG